MGRRQKSSIVRICSVSLVAFLVGLTLLGGNSISHSAASSPVYNNVQVFVKTQSASADSFLISAYNSTGGLVTTSQSEYPAFSFELPSGTYLFTVTASQPYDYKNPQAVGIGQSSSAILYPISSNPAEYGYSLIPVTSSTSVNISTTPISDLKTTKLTVHVNFQNGSAVYDASVGATIVGAWYWVYENNVILTNQTNQNGVATLTVPSVPLQITAWSWVQVNLPSSQTTTQVNIGGQKVNVTVYWEPTYVGLAGEALIIPPQSSASITLMSQQQSYWATPYGVGIPQSVGGASSPAVANGAGAVPANQYSAVSGGPSGSVVSTQTISNQIPSLPSATTTTTEVIASSNTILLLEIGLIASVLIAASGLVLVARKK